MSEEELKKLLVRLDNLENFCLSFGMITTSTPYTVEDTVALHNLVNAFNDNLNAMGLDTDPRMFDDGV